MEKDEKRPASGPEEERGPAEPAEAQPREAEAPEELKEAQPAGATPESEAPTDPAKGRPGGATAEADDPADPAKGGPAAGGEPTKAQGPGPGPELAVALSAAMFVVAAAFFIAGFAAHALLDEDGGGGGSGGGGGGDGSGGAVASAGDDDPFWGPEDAAVTIEEFADFQCPYCGRHATQTLPQIKAAYGDRVRYIYRDFPLTGIHQNAQKAAEAAQCAHDQGLFWEYHDLLFANQQALTVADLKSYAGQVGADEGEFNDCLDSGKNSREVLLDLQDGRAGGISGTPGFLINGQLFTGAQPFEQFQLVIEQALATGGQ